MEPQTLVLVLLVDPALLSVLVDMYKYCLNYKGRKGLHTHESART